MRSSKTTVIKVSPMFVALFMALSLITVLFISEAQASWFSEYFSFFQRPQQKLEALEDNPTVSVPGVEVPSATNVAAINIQQASQADLFQGSIKNIAEQLFAHLEDKAPQSGLLADGLAFTVFADLKKLSRTSSFGRYLSEQLMGEFQQQGFPVVEVRKSNAIMVMEKRGEYGLSRDLHEIGAAAQARTLLTGTYTVAGDKIMVNAKILDNANSALLSSATVLFEKNALTESLLADAASAYQRKDAYVYMKKLEL